MTQLQLLIYHYVINMTKLEVFLSFMLIIETIALCFFLFDTFKEKKRLKKWHL